MGIVPHYRAPWGCQSKGLKGPAIELGLGPRFNLFRGGHVAQAIVFKGEMRELVS